MRVTVDHNIRVPSLEERREDLPLLIVRMLESVGAEQGKEIRGVALDTLDSLLSHPFEGEMASCASVQYFFSNYKKGATE